MNRMPCKPISSAALLLLLGTILPAGCGSDDPDSAQAGASGTAQPGSPPPSGESGGGQRGSGGSKAQPAAGNGGSDRTPTSDAGSTPSKSWRPFNATSPWNTPIDANAKADPKSTELIADLIASSQWPWITINIETYSIPVYQVDANTPLQTVTVTSVGGQGFNAGSAKVPIPKGALPAEGTDAHLAIVNRATNQEWGMWSTSSTASGWTAEVAATADLSGTGVRPPTADAPWWMGHGARACGYPLSAGLITLDDMQAGAIEHALVIAYPHIRSRYYTSPASTAQAGFSTALPTRGMPCGARVQLDPTLDLASLKLSASGKIVARALQKYGAFVGDFSGAVSLYADASPAAQSAFAKGLLDTYEVKDALTLKLFRALPIGTLLDNAN